jgi:hypothetical protein
VNIGRRAGATVSATTGIVTWVPHIPVQVKNLQHEQPGGNQDADNFGTEDEKQSAASRLYRNVGGNAGYDDEKEVESSKKKDR